MVKHMFGLVVVVGVVLGAAGVAEACSCSNRCTEVLMDSWISIPANTPGFPLALDYRRQGDYVMPSWTLTNVNRSTGHPLSVHAVENPPARFGFLDGWDGYLIQPEGVLEEGRYVLQSPDSLCDLWGDQYPLTIFQLTPAVPLPQSLGQIDEIRSHKSLVSVNTDSGCSGLFEAAIASVQVRLTEEAEPWRDALFFTTLVDGERWEERSSFCEQPPLGGDSGGRGHAQLFALCGQFNAGLEPGRHTVKMLAWLPGTDLVLETEEAEFELDCTELEASLAELEADRNRVCEESPAVEDDRMGEEAPAGGGASVDEEGEGCNVAAPSGVTSGGWLGLALAGLGVWAGLRRR
jgi:hypothetical protein